MRSTKTRLHRILLVRGLRAPNGIYCGACRLIIGPHGPIIVVTKNPLRIGFTSTNQGLMPLEFGYTEGPEAPPAVDYYWRWRLLAGGGAYYFSGAYGPLNNTPMKDYQKDSRVTLSC